MNGFNPPNKNTLSQNIANYYSKKIASRKNIFNKIHYNASFYNLVSIIYLNNKYYIKFIKNKTGA